MSYAIFWLAVMVLIGFFTYKAVLDQPDLIPQDKNQKEERNIGEIRGLTPRIEEVAPDGHVRWRLESEGMEGDIEGLFNVTNAEAVIYLSDGSQIRLSAPEGSYDRPKRNFILKGGVTAVNEDEQSEFWATQVEWNGESRILKSSGGTIKLTRGNWDFHASGITIDLSGEETKIELDEPVNVVGYKS